MYIPYGIIEWYKYEVCNLYPYQIGNLHWHAVLKSLILNNRSAPTFTMCILPLSLRKIRIFPINIKFRTIEKSLSWYCATHVIGISWLFFLLNHPWILLWTSGMEILDSFSSSFFISILRMFFVYCPCFVTTVSVLFSLSEESRPLSILLAEVPQKWLQTWDDKVATPAWN